MAKIAKTADRVVLIEDTRELQCKSANLVALRTRDGAQFTVLEERPAALLTFLDGLSLGRPRASHCAEAGATLIQLNWHNEEIVLPVGQVRGQIVSIDWTENPMRAM